MNIFGNVLIYGTLSALSGLEFITTKATTTSSLSIVNIGIGPALYVEQDGFYDIARFVDREGGIVLNVGNITPPAPGTNGGVIGIRTDFPNHTLTVVGTFSASSDIYTDGVIVSAGVPLDTIIFNATGPLVRSVAATMSANSAKWESSYSYLNSNSGNLVTFQLLSTTPIVLSAANIMGNVNIFGNLFAAGSAFFANTIITTTSALSVINAGPGPALFVSQGRGSGDIASFYDGDTSQEVLHVGNATDINGNDKDGVIGIKTSQPNKTLTVVGDISATGGINNLTIDYTQGNIVLGKNTTITSFGYDNVFIGRDVATNNTFGVNNTFVGTQAGGNNTQGNNNVFIGQSAGQANTLGSGNVAVGCQAATSLQTGNTNCIVGNYAGSSITLGGGNVILGDSAGINMISANFSICIGQGAGTTGDYSRVVAIGPNARASEDFQFVAGASIEQGGFPFSKNSRYYGDLNFTGRLSANSMITNGLTALGPVSVGTAQTSDYKLRIGGTGLNSGFTAGISLNGGQAGSDYDGIGYNFRPTNTNGIYNYNVSDVSSRLEFYNGGFLFKNAPSGVPGNAITYTSRVNINSNGNVGIGTTSPSANGLEISKTAGSNSGVKITSGTESAELVVNSTAGFYVSNNSTTLPTMLWTNGAERLRIDSSGNVGINETSSTYKLEVKSSTTYLTLRLKDPSSTIDQGVNLAFQSRNVTPAYYDSGYITVRNSATNQTAGSESSYMAFYTRGTGTAAERLRINAASDITSTLPIRYAGDPSNSNDLTRSSYITALNRWTRTTTGVTLNGTAALQKIAADTTGGAFTITLPATPDEGLEIQIVDAGRFSTFNNITIARNGKTINGDADNMLIDKNGAFIILIYLLNDWKVVGVA